ncbi:hypothetical protein D3C87_20540 [compost metagenome]
MKKFLFLASFCLLIQSSFAQNGISFKFKVSKPYCVFNFMESAIYHHTTSSTLQKFIDEKTKTNKEFAKLCNEFAAIRLEYTYTRDEYPVSRRQNRTTFDLINIALVNSGNIEEFGQRIIGILPNDETQRLLNILLKAEAIYDQLIWNENESKITAQLSALESYATQCSENFYKIKQFYNSAWSSDIPFHVALYPIPVMSGSTTATPYANSLCVGVLADETNHVARIGVVLHEMCHVLYDEQSAAFQHTLDSWFAENQSPYKSFAYNFFDEGLATALGNGWAYKNLSGKLDPDAWYDNEYINGFAKALYPMIEEYLSNGKQLDQEFVNKAIDLFAATFPNSLTDYAILMNRVSIYNDAETGPEINAMRDLIGRYFQMTNSNFSAPILDPISVEMLKNNESTQLIVIDKNHAATMKELKKVFPQLAKVKPVSNSVLSFRDTKNRAVIIIYAVDKNGVDQLLKEMKTKKYFDKTTVVQK